MIDPRLKTIADYYGYNRQAEQLIEEMAELTQAVYKYKHDTSKRSERNLAEELADVEIMLEQVKYLLANETEVELHRNAKIVRQLYRMGLEE